MNPRFGVEPSGVLDLHSNLVLDVDMDLDESKRNHNVSDRQSDMDLEEAIRISLLDKPVEPPLPPHRHIPNPRRRRRISTPPESNSSPWDDSFCDVVSVGKAIGLGDSVLQDSSERLNVNFERAYRETREFSVHGVPGDGSCFFHAVIEGIRQSSHLWKNMLNPSPLPGDPITFCDLIVRWWSRYVTTVPGLVTEDDIHDHLDFKFLRYITSESITDDLYSTYEEIVEYEKGFPVSDRMLTPYRSKEDLKNAVKNRRSCWADDFTVNTLNKALDPFLNIVIVTQSPDNPNLRTVRHSDNKANSYIWVLLRGNHYNLLKKTGLYEPSGGDFIETVSSNDASMLKYVRTDWC